MLIALMTAFLLGGGVFGGSPLTPAEIDVVGKRVELAVTDPENQAAALQIIEELDTETKAYNQIFFDSGDQLKALYADHEATNYQLQKTLEILNTEWYVSQQRSLKLRYQLKESIDADEWAQIFGR